jgi:hypothetical protein
MCLMKAIGAWVRSMDSGSLLCGPIPRHFQKKSKYEILENTQTLEIFAKKHPKFFWNYILVHVILHIGPCLIFYNYN